MTINIVSCQSRISNKMKGWTGSCISILHTKLPHLISGFTATPHLKEQCKPEITLCNVLQHKFRGVNKAPRHILEVTHML